MAGSRIATAAAKPEEHPSEEDVDMDKQISGIVDEIFDGAGDGGTVVADASRRDIAAKRVAALVGRVAKRSKHQTGCG